MLGSEQQSGPAAIVDLGPQLRMQLPVLEGMQPHLAMAIGEARRQLICLRTDLGVKRRKFEGFGLRGECAGGHRDSDLVSRWRCVCPGAKSSPVARDLRRVV